MLKALNNSRTGELYKTQKQKTEKTEAPENSGVKLPFVGNCIRRRVS